MGFSSKSLGSKRAHYNAGSGPLQCARVAKIPQSVFNFD